MLDDLLGAMRALFGQLNKAVAWRVALETRALGAHSLPSADVTTARGFEARALVDAKMRREELL